MPLILERTLRFIFAITAGTSLFASAQDAPESAKSDEPTSVFSERSPWLLAPVLNSNPKLGTTVGALGGYLHFFDAKSRPSIFAVSGQYSDTDSIVGGAFARASFDEDHQRLIAGLAYGNVNNDYDDYLGTGVPLKNEAELESFIARYTYRIRDDWFIGAQGISQNFGVTGDSAFDDQVLDILGVVPFESAGAGLVVQNDSRDDENMPTRGWLFNFNNMAFREALGGDDDYGVYRLEFKYFHQNRNNHIFALRQLNHLTKDAPTAAQASVQLRGYKIGQYGDKYMSSIEGEERFRLGKKWTATLFAGTAYLYGGNSSSSDSENFYPVAGLGIQYILKPKEGMVMNLEYADGKGDNSGVYLKMGYSY
ncbi:MAG TPA: BamA/TamA family outer membrane protein [Cellvibrio sp.]|nr:BamA/TamA family outer membrane protein [Cellvibrio sp.]